jgi:hypothetical protein
MDTHSSPTKGIIVPLALAVYAVRIFVTGEVLFRRRYSGSPIFWGFDAHLLGIAILAFALAMHGFLYWNNNQRLANYAPIPIAAGLLIFGIAILWLAIRQFANFI